MCSTWTMKSQSVNPRALIDRVRFDPSLYMLLLNSKAKRTIFSLHITYACIR